MSQTQTLSPALGDEGDQQCGGKPGLEAGTDENSRKIGPIPQTPASC